MLQVLMGILIFPIFLLNKSHKTCEKVKMHLKKLNKIKKIYWNSCKFKKSINNSYNKKIKDS